MGRSRPEASGAPVLQSFEPDLTARRGCAADERNELEDEVIIMSNQTCAFYGDVDGSGESDLDDLMCMLAGLSGIFNCRGVLPDDLDIAPCIDGDGDLNLHDLLGLLDTLAGSAPCDDVCK